MRISCCIRRVVNKLFVGSESRLVKVVSSSPVNLPDIKPCPLYSISSNIRRRFHDGRPSLPRALQQHDEQGRASNPQIPLCERPATHVTSLKSLLTSYEEMEKNLIAVGNSLSADGGPTQEELLTELEWLMEDAVGLCLGADDAWDPIEWKDVEVMDGRKHNISLKLRIPLLQLRNLWQKRLTERIPLQYLTSSAFWRDMVLSVGPGVLIPRPETELMIDFVAEAAGKMQDTLLEHDWVDLGTGSGALAIGIARALPSVPTVWAVDIAPEPITYATFNAKRYEVSERVKVIRSNWLDGLVDAGVQKLGGIVSNPPYISRNELPGLQAEVYQHEPSLALDGGHGLAIDSLIPICQGAARLLQPGGFLALETSGGEQAQYVAHVLQHIKVGDILSDNREETLVFCDVAIRRDLRGVNRFVCAIKSRQ